MNNILKGFLLKNKTAAIFLLIALFGVLLLVFGSFESNEKNTFDDCSEYIKQAEKDIAAIAEKICGGKAYVVVTADVGKTDNYAVNGDGTYAQMNSSPIYLGTKEPEIRGVAVVCYNGSNPTVQADIVSAICCAYGIGQSKVYVCGGR